MAQYEQKILQGQRQRRGRFSNTSTPDVSHHASVCSSEHPTPRGHQPLHRGTGEGGSGSGEQENDSHTADNRLAAHRAGPDQARAAKNHLWQLPERGPSESPRPAQGTAPERLDVAEDDADASAAAAITFYASGRHHGTDLDSDGKRDEARSAAAAPLNAQLDSGGDAASASGPTVNVSMEKSWASGADRSQQPAESSAHSDAEVLPISTRASALPGFEPDPQLHPCRGAPSVADAAPAVAESACTGITSSRSLTQPEPVSPPGDAAAAPLLMQSAEESPVSSVTIEPSAGTPWSLSTAGITMHLRSCSRHRHTACLPAVKAPQQREIHCTAAFGSDLSFTAGHGEHTGSVDAPDKCTDRDKPSGRSAVNATPCSSSNAAATGVPVSANAATPSSSGEAMPGNSGAAEADRAAAPGSGPGLAAGHAGARQQDNGGRQLLAESAREPEWVAAFRRVVSLAINTPLSQSPAMRRTSLPDGGLPVPPDVLSVLDMACQMLEAHPCILPGMASL